MRTQKEATPRVRSRYRPENARVVSCSLPELDRRWLNRISAESGVSAGQVVKQAVLTTIRRRAREILAAEAAALADPPPVESADTSSSPSQE